jgi:hypothetical protein
MIHEVAITENDHILEIGTGTGYLTALLCHRLGASNITSIDIDPDLIDSADRILTELGYSPTLATADGTHGYPDRAPYNRILGTAAVEGVPRSWIGQTRPFSGVRYPFAHSTTRIFDFSSTWPCPASNTTIKNPSAASSCATPTAPQLRSAPPAKPCSTAPGDSATILPLYTRSGTTQEVPALRHDPDRCGHTTR